jgi:hypothetical protein
MKQRLQNTSLKHFLQTRVASSVHMQQNRSLSLSEELADERDARRRWAGFWFALCAD